MYRIPIDLDLSNIVGRFATQIRVGQFDLQFNLGDVHFTIESTIEIQQNDEVTGKWTPGQWPDPQFYDIMNSEVVDYEIPNERLLILKFENGFEMCLNDNSDQYECIKISIKGDAKQWII